MEPRNLRVLRIDDVHSDGRSPISDLSWQEIDTLPPALESFASQDGRGAIETLNGWSTALRLWIAMPVDLAPDLVVADVLFEGDDSTPLGEVEGFEGYPRFIPTGLSHLKPFAALARARSRPLGIGIHTRNAAVWADAWAKRHPMGALAAHEIGELAAILGDPIEGETMERQVERCWDWLKRRSRGDFHPALRIAMGEYRRRLVEAGKGDGGRPRALVLPRDWIRLRNWAESRARSAPAPIEPDLGLPILFADGSRDLIRIVSLFGEVKDVESRSIPSSCFETSQPAGGELSPWLLDDAGRPQIGRFVASLGRIAQAFEEAVALVQRFPLSHGEGQRLESTLLEEAEGCRDRDLVAGLAIFFQALRWEAAKHRLWQEGLEEPGWSCSQRRLVSPADSGHTLAETLTILAGAVARLAGPPFARCDVPESTEIDLFTEEGANSDEIRWHFERLVDAGLLVYQPKDDVYEVVPRRRFSIAQLPAPRRLPPGFPNDGLDELKSTLRDSLGFGRRYGPRSSNQEQMIGRRLAAAFCDSSDEGLGRELLDQVLDGHGPAWLLELLREYAADKLEWGEERCWPRWLQPG